MGSISLQAAVAMLTLGVVGCGNPGELDGPEPAVPIVSVQGVKVTPQSLQFLAIGETRHLVVTIAPANATDRGIVWESTDPTIASVDSAGLVTARAAGDGVFITAYTHDGHHEASVNVTVAP